MMRLRQVIVKGSYFYFLSTTFAVTIFFIFCAIYYNPSFEDFHTGVSKINIMFKVSAVIVLMFSTVFVYYANTLFIRSRKREIAIFALLGMKNFEIGSMLFCEPLLVGIGAIGVGLIAGSLFVRFFSMILLRLMLGGAPGNSLDFKIVLAPYIVNLVVFIGLFVLNAISSLRIIYRYELSELLSFRW